MKRTILALTLAVIITGSAVALIGSYGPEGADKKILIAYESTRFKNRLIEELLSELDDGTVYIAVVDHSKEGLEGLSAGDYDAVFITNSGATAKVRPWVTEWLDENGGDPDNVIVHTTQINEWTPQVEVDSITSASLNRRNDIRSLASEYAERIKDKMQ